MKVTLVCLAIAVLSGILCFIAEKWEKIPVHIDQHRDPILAAITGAVTAFIASISIFYV
jgi:hypothetical protein